MIKKKRAKRQGKESETDTQEGHRRRQYMRETDTKRDGRGGTAEETDTPMPP